MIGYGVVEMEGWRGTGMSRVIGGPVGGCMVVVVGGLVFVTSNWRGFMVCRRMVRCVVCLLVLVKVPLEMVIKEMLALMETLMKRESVNGV